MAAAKTLTTKVLAIGPWTAKATPETRLAITLAVFDLPFKAQRRTPEGAAEGVARETQRTSQLKPLLERARLCISGTEDNLVTTRSATQIAMGGN
jgi:hypothetical protein